LQQLLAIDTFVLAVALFMATICPERFQSMQSAGTQAEV
jgi:hypothetical protein